MPTYLLILTILISVVFAGCSVVGILNKKIRKKVEIIQSDNISDDDVEKVEDDSEAADQNLISDLDLSLVEQKTESDKRKSNSVFLHVFRAVPFLGTVAICLWFIFRFGYTDSIFILKRVYLIAILFVAAYYDHMEFRIPNTLIIFGIAGRIGFLVFELFFLRDSISATLISEGIALALMVLISVICLIVVHNGIGMGDIKLFIVMALLQGITGVISSIFCTLIVAFVFSVILIAAKKKSRKDFIAFAPCILVGTLISMILIGA